MQGVLQEQWTGCGPLSSGSVGARGPRGLWTSPAVVPSTWRAPWKGIARAGSLSHVC